MATSRLTGALEQGALDLPDGLVRVLRPAGSYDLSGLDPARVEIEHGDISERQTWQDRSYALAGDGPVPTVIVVVPRSKGLARALVKQAVRQATDLVIVDGQKTDGVDSLFKACKPWADIRGNVTRAHGRLFWFRPGQTPMWDVEPKLVEGFVTRPGVFSEDKVDRGSRLLADSLPRLSGRVVDLGAGWGFLSAAILRHPAVTRLDMVEAEQLAIECLNQNIKDDRARAIWADATAYQVDQPYDAVVTNPPFHVGRKGDPDLGKAFLDTAARVLGRNGQVFVVANRHLPYEAHLRSLFLEVEETGGDQGFKLIRASRPNR